MWLLLTSLLYFDRENCDTLASKELRAFYRRPEVIPPMVEIAPSNWVFIAEDYKGENLKLVSMPFITIKKHLVEYAHCRKL